MWIDTHLAYEVASEIVKEISNDHNEHTGPDTQQQAPQPRRRLKLAAVFTWLFQRRKSTQSPAPESTNQRRMA